MGKGDVPTYIDLPTDMEDCFPSSTALQNHELYFLCLQDAAAIQAKRTQLVQRLSENMLKGENMMSKAKAKHSTVKNIIGWIFSMVLIIY